jgi:S-adenosyl-L-methionine hydrolase (adenosine-forming)
MVLSDSMSYMPEDAVYLAVVDPGVGTSRPDVAVRARSGVDLVGPDNGVLSLAWDRLGGIDRAVEITSPAVVLPFVSSTFRARDVFAPAAAHLARGTPLEALGSVIDDRSLVRVSIPAREVRRGRIDCQVLDRDRFGNVQLNVRGEDLAGSTLEERDVLELTTPTGSVPVRRVRTFGDVAAGELGALIDSRGWLAVACNGGSAAEALRLSVGDAVSIEPASEDRDPGSQTRPPPAG